MTVIARNPVRYRPLMLVSVLEKLAYGIPAIALFMQQRLKTMTLAFGCIDLVLGALACSRAGGVALIPTICSLRILDVIVTSCDATRLAKSSTLTFSARATMNLPGSAAADLWRGAGFGHVGTTSSSALVLWKVHATRTKLERAQTMVAPARGLPLHGPITPPKELGALSMPIVEVVRVTLPS